MNLSSQIDRDKKSLTRFDKQRDRDAEMLRTVTENLERAFHTNDSISIDMKRETEKLKKEEDGIRVRLDFHSIEFFHSIVRQQWNPSDDKFMKNQL